MSEKPSMSQDVIYGLICLGVGAWIYTELHSLHYGEEEVIEVWTPIAFLYENLGFEVAVAVLPIFGSFFLLRGVYKLFT